MDQRKSPSMSLGAAPGMNMDMRGEIAAMQEKMVPQRCRFIAEWVKLIASSLMEQEYRNCIRLPHDSYREGVAARFALSFLRHEEKEGNLEKLESCFSTTEGIASVQNRIHSHLWDWWQGDRVQYSYIHEPLDEQGARPLALEYGKAVRKSGGLGNIDSYARVRNARYVDVNADNIDDMLPKIGDSYKRAWLRPETLEKLTTNDARDARDFRDKVKKGVFVYEWEREHGASSLKDQFRRDITEEKNHMHEPTFQCRCLLDDDGKILSWLTYWKPPVIPGASGHKEMVLDYLKHGATGGNLRFTRQPKYKQYKNNLNRILLFDTLRSEVPMAASRLFAKVSQEMVSQSPEIRYMISYRLHELFVKPAFPAMREPVRLSENTSSERFFRDRDFIIIGYDFNKKGPLSPRVLSDGSEISLNPEWVVLSGEMHDVYHDSVRIWQTVQGRYGDISRDDLQPDRYCRRFAPYVFRPEQAEKGDGSVMRGSEGEV